jgi:hypothetical protein
MEIKLEYLAGLAQVRINSTSDDPDESVKPEVIFQKGDLGRNVDLDDVQFIFYSELRSASGFYGHTFDIIDTTNLDLIAALSSMDTFDVVSIEPDIRPTVLAENELT